MKLNPTNRQRKQRLFEAVKAAKDSFETLCASGVFSGLNEIHETQKHRLIKSINTALTLASILNNREGGKA